MVPEENTEAEPGEDHDGELNGDTVGDGGGDRVFYATQESQQDDVTSQFAQMALPGEQANTMPSSMSSHQGNSNTCTSHAIAKCICALYPYDGLNAQNIADCVNQIFKDINGGTLPEEYNGKSIRVILRNDPGSFTLVVQQCDIANLRPTETDQFLICYEDRSFHSPFYHSIYVKDVLEECFECINSWGEDTSTFVRKSNVQAAYRVGARWIPDLDSRVEEPTVDDLTFGDIQAISMKLDDGQSWFTFGMLLVETYGDQINMHKNDIENLHLCYGGGGSPADEFLRNLKTSKPNYKLLEFRNLAEKLKRNDIVLKTEDWEEYLLADLTIQHRKSIINLLEKKVVTSHDWRGFADELGFSNSEIKRIGETIKVPGKSSPSTELIDILQKNAPNFQLNWLRKLFQDVSRNDIFNLVNDIAQRHKDEKIQRINTDRVVF